MGYDEKLEFLPAFLWGLSPFVYGLHFFCVLQFLKGYPSDYFIE
jgi:hypothetical protein